VDVANDGDAELELESVVADDGIDTELERSTLAPGEETTLELTFRTDELAESFAQRVTINTNAPASPTQIRVAGETGNGGSGTFVAEGVETTRPVEGDALQVTTEIRNTGTAEATQTVEIDAGSLGANATAVTLGPGESTTETLGIETEPGDAGSYTVRVVTDNASESVNAAVLTAGGVTVEIAETSEPTVGEPLTVALDVQNTGETEATETLGVDADGLGGNTTTVTLSAGESTTETLALDTSGAEPGIYTVEATAGDGDGDTAEVTVDADREPGVVSGRVTDTESEAVEGATVEVLDDGAVVATTDSGPEGRYTVEVAPGTYTLRVSKAGLVTGETAVAAERGETTAADVVLQRAANRTTVRLTPAEQRVGVDQTSRYEVVVTDASTGVGSYEFVARVSDTDTAIITDATANGTEDGGTLTTVDVADDGGSATVLTAAADLDGGATTTIATLTVEGVTPGTTSVSLGDATVGDSQAQSYTVENVSGASAVVEDVGPVVVGGQPATDPNGDGEYEDINGDGTVDIVDVSAFFENRNSDTMEDNPESLDFNGDGVVNIVDISKLFEEVSV
jgi:hypothetical protein